MTETVEITEFVRFNPDGSSSHIKVLDGELFDTYEINPSPYLIVDPWPPVPAGDKCDWIVEINRVQGDLLVRSIMGKTQGEQ